MSIRSLCCCLALLALGGCERAKDLLGSAAGGVVGKAEITPGGEISPELGSLVLREEDGVKFRRDLVFPARLEVRMMHKQEFGGVRGIEVSAFGKKSTVIDQKTETEIVCSKGPGLFDLSLDKAGRRIVEKDEEEAPDPETEKGRASELEGESLSFALLESGWRTRHAAGSVDFKKAVWADSLEGHVAQLMAEAGAHPRVQWFSSSRVWRTGDEIMLTGNALKIIEPFDVSGRLKLRFEGVEAVGGHPCGVFSVTGSMRVRDEVDVDGSIRDADITVVSGRIWASLLHPVLLREEYDTVQTVVLREGKRGGPESRLQGSIGVRKFRNWSPLEG